MVRDAIKLNNKELPTNKDFDDTLFSHVFSQLHAVWKATKTIRTVETTVKDAKAASFEAAVAAFAALEIAQARFSDNDMAEADEAAKDTDGTLDQSIKTLKAAKAAKDAAEKLKEAVEAADGAAYRAAYRATQDVSFCPTYNVTETPRISRFYQALSTVFAKGNMAISPPSHSANLDIINELNGKLVSNELPAGDGLKPNYLFITNPICVYTYAVELDSPDITIKATYKSPGADSSTTSAKTASPASPSGNQPGTNPPPQPTVAPSSGS